MTSYEDLTVIKAMNGVFALSIKLLTQITVMNQRPCSWDEP